MSWYSPHFIWYTPKNRELWNQKYKADASFSFSFFFSPAEERSVENYRSLHENCMSSHKKRQVPFRENILVAKLHFLLDG